jgi:hypothetical protein
MAGRSSDGATALARASRIAKLEMQGG